MNSRKRSKQVSQLTPYPEGLETLTRSLIWALVILVYCLLVELSHAADEPANLDQIVDAIYLAEGGERARKPFGILSVPCEGYTDCRRICRNTVRNTYRRWQAAGQPGDYLSFLAKRYCPIGAPNDPQGLNRNWLKNVRYFLNK